MKIKYTPQKCSPAVKSSISQPIISNALEVERIVPANVAQLILVLFRILFIGVLVVEAYLFFPMLKMCIEYDVPRELMINFIVDVVITYVVTIITYIISSRLSIAVLMNWHFSKDIAQTNRKLLTEMQRLNERLSALTTSSPFD